MSRPAFSPKPIEASKALWQACQARPKRAIFLAGALLPLAFAPFYLLPIFYLSYGIAFALAWQIIQQTTQQTDKPLLKLALLGWWFGFGQFFTGLLWMGEAFLVEAERFLWALPFAITLLPAGLALFTALAFGLWGWAQQRLADTRAWALLGLALALALAAFARSTVLTGLPWNLPAMAWASWLYPAQLTAFIGVHGVSLVALLSVVPLFAAQAKWRWLALLIPLLASLFGAARVHITQTINSDVHVAVIQPNLAQREKWLPEKRQAHIDKTFALTRLALDYAPHTDLLIWPETAIPALIDEGPGFADRLRANLPAGSGAVPYILTGAVRRDITAAGQKFYNSAMLWSGDGHMLARSDKHHLVPFGEYLPLQDWLESIGLEQLARLRGGYHNGPPHARLSAARLPLMAPLICYEAIFPALSGGTPRPAVLVNITNDGWFGQWHGPYQHLVQARLRAIEQGVPLLRAANTGISAAFDGHGRVLDHLPLGTAGSFSLPLPKPLPPTLYHHIGDAGFGLMCFALLGGLVWRRQKRHARR